MTHPAENLHFNYELQVWVRNGICTDVGLNRDLYCGLKETDAVWLSSDGYAPRHWPAIKAHDLGGGDSTS